MSVSQACNKLYNDKAAKSHTHSISDIGGIALNQETSVFSTLANQQVTFTTATSYAPKAVFGIIFGAQSSNTVIVNIVYTTSGKNITWYVYCNIAQKATIRFHYFY